jgi:hypothetical protein
MNKKGENRKFSQCNFLPKNNKGQDLSTSTIILIILGIAVLVILIIGFTIGWQKVVPWLSSNNVDTIVNQCQASCTTSDTYGYCSLNRTLTASDLPNDAEGKAQKNVINTCNFFSNDENYLKYNIGKCPSLCPTPAA